MPETIIESVLTGKLCANLLIKWLNNESIEDASEDCILLCCNRSEFVAYFLSYIRTQTDGILQTNSNALQILQHQSTPEKILNSRRKHHRSISDPTNDIDHSMDSLSVKTDRQRSHESPSKDRKKTGRRVKTKLFPDDRKESTQSISSSDESRLSLGIEQIALHSTPMKNGLKWSEYSNSPLASPVTPHSRSYKEHHERCDTPRLSYRHSKSHDKSISLGDYLINAQTKSSKKKKSSSARNVSSEVENENKGELDLSNSEIFPNLGMRKSSSLRSEKRRIKPTNIDGSAQKSFSISNFGECFQQQSPLVLEENSAFKHQKLQPKELANGFETERNILKLERHKLMEKFNILNTSTSSKPMATPQIKITHKDSIDHKREYIKVDLNKVCFKEKLDILVDIYDILLKNNLIMSINTEIYYLISILLSKQLEDDYSDIECFLNNNIITNYLLKSIHNSTYFAIKSLWNERLILEVILDKNSLKTLGENKKIRSFYPDLAKFLLNSYGLKCEAEINPDKIKMQDSRGTNSNGIVCFNLETDNAENFPSMLSFQNFKKQRDMFYEILRWYQDGESGVGSRTGLRARAKALVSCGPAAANHAHLAALTVAHLVAESAQLGQESKLSKLQRRLTRPPAAPADHRLPHFAPDELFYKDLIIHAENESFRVHLRDALASEIIALDCTPIAAEDRANNTDTSRDFLQLSKKLRLLAKFLGFITALPYSQTTAEPTFKTRTSNGPQKDNYAPPKEKVLENNIALRNYSQPNIDLKSILTNAERNGHLCITVPWIVHYLSMMDYTSLRIKYFQELLKHLFDIYTNKLKFTNEQTNMKKNTIIYMQSCLSWLFDLPHFPQELFYEKNNFKSSVASELNIDSYDLIDESILFELCPYLRDVNVLLSTCKVSHEQKNAGSFRHITPVSLSLNPEDRMRNKEKELQARLEEELLKSQPSSTRRVLELVTERVTAACVRQLSAHALSEARSKARAHAVAAVKAHRGDTATLFQTLQSLYNEHLQQLRTSALEAGTAAVRSRIGGALTALLPAAPPPLHALAARGCAGRLARWLNDNWNGTAILCKDIESEMRTLIALGELATVAGSSKGCANADAMTTSREQFDAVHVSTAATLIQLKEQVCLLLDYEEPTDLFLCLSAAATSCSPNNLFNRPATQRAIMQLSIDLCIVYVSRKPKEVNDTFLNKLHAIWNTCCPDRKKKSTNEIEHSERKDNSSPELRNFNEDERVPTPISDEESNINSPKIMVNGVEDSKNYAAEFKSNVAELKSTVTELKSNAAEFKSSVSPSKANASLFKSSASPSKSNPAEFKSIVSETKVDVTDGKIEEFNDEILEFFDRILCPRNIVLLNDTNCKCSEVWESLATVLVFLLKNDYLSEDSLTEQCLAVYRQDWPQTILENLSTCMKSVSSRWSRSSTGKFTLFLDFLAEYCGDMEYEPIE